MAMRVGVVTVSDRCSRGEAEDASGPLIREWVSERLQAQVVQQCIVPDEADAIRETLLSWSDEEKLDLIITSGGTGFAPRDITPEVTKQVIERETPGLAEVMRSEGYRKTPHAMLSRAVAGIRGGTLIVNMPGSPKAVRDGLEAITPALPHAIEILRGTHGSDTRHEFKE